MNTKQMSWGKFKRACRSRDGVTMVELMAVVLIIAVVSGIVLGISGYATRKADESRAQAELQVLRTLLDAYRIAQGQYPHHDISFEGDWEDVFGPQDPEGSFGNAAFDWRDYADSVSYEDPWGNNYVYISRGRYSYDLYSEGPPGLNQPIR